MYKLNSEIVELIRGAGKRATNARVLVSVVLQNTKDHMTPVEIIREVSASGGHIDPSTIYRVLADLRDIGMIAESRFKPGEPRYEWIYGESHHHLHCKFCGDTIPLDTVLVKKFSESIEGTHGFTSNLSHLVLPGKCIQCKSN